jgi:hypothetical protein
MLRHRDTVLIERGPIRQSMGVFEQELPRAVGISAAMVTYTLHAEMSSWDVMRLATGCVVRVMYLNIMVEPGTVRPRGGAMSRVISRHKSGGSMLWHRVRRSSDSPCG